jgi:flagellin-like hook-associated protein FlgL
MLINTDLSSDTAAMARPQIRTDTGTAASAPPNSPAASQVDPSLQRLTGRPVEMQDADCAIQDQAGADQATSFARLNILSQPGTALASQANQLSQNVLSLLQTID